MATNTLKSRIVHVSKTTLEWASESTVILKGEMAIEFTDSGAPKIKYGDGTKTFAQLPYATMTPEEIETAIEQGIQDVVGDSTHSHNNKDILDQITAAFTTELKSTYDAATTKANTAIQTVKLGGVEVQKSNGEVNIDAYTKSETDSKIATAVANSEHLKREIVEDLPDTGSADQHTIYMVSKDDGSGNQQYDEYMLINGTFEKIGDSAVNLTGYATESYVDQAESDAIATAGTNADSKIAAKVGEIGDGTVKDYVDQAETDAVNAAKSYADGLASNYATAEQGEKADSAVQSVKITGNDSELNVDGNVTLPAYPTSVESANKLVTSRNFSVSGGATASDVGFDGTGDVNLVVTELDAIKLKVAEGDSLILDGSF